ncbi:hypothetical protein BDZ89DRAFT_1071581 [Hymenopellis radicata]|nr:hypothetical protein BDZ89DRAFT_1071581 [Hymenopellis radicata]
MEGDPPDEPYARPAHSGPSPGATTFRCERGRSGRFVCPIKRCEQEFSDTTALRQHIESRNHLGWAAVPSVNDLGHQTTPLLPLLQCRPPEPDMSDEEMAELIREENESIAERLRLAGIEPKVIPEKEDNARFWRTLARLNPYGRRAIVTADSRCYSCQAKFGNQQELEDHMRANIRHLKRGRDARGMDVLYYDENDLD